MGAAVEEKKWKTTTRTAAVTTATTSTSGKVRGIGLFGVLMVLHLEPTLIVEGRKREGGGNVL